MSLRYAFTCDTVGNGQFHHGGSGGPLIMLRDGWYYGEAHSACAGNIVDSSRQPLIGYGGSYRAMRLNGYTFGGTPKACYVYSPDPTFTAQSDGIFQFHFYAAHYGYNDNMLPFFRLLSGTTIVLEVRFNGNRDGTLQLYYWNGSSLSLGLTTSATANEDEWHSIAIRLKTGNTDGRIKVSIDGGTAEDSGDLVMNHALAWNRFLCWSDGNSSSSYYRYFAQFSVFTDTSDAMLETQKWVTQLRPTGDATAPDSDWTGTPNGTPDLHDNVNEINFSASDYCTTIVDPPDEIRFYPDYTETPANGGINAAWDPPVIDGVVVNAVMRGDGTLNQGQAVVKCGATSDYGDTTVLSGDSTLVPYEVHATKPGGGAWAKTDLTGTATEFGVKAS